MTDLPLEFDRVYAEEHAAGWTTMTPTRCVSALVADALEHGVSDEYLQRALDVVGWCIQSARGTAGELQPGIMDDPFVKTWPELLTIIEVLELEGPNVASERLAALSLASRAGILGSPL